MNGALSNEPLVAHDPSPSVIVSPNSSPEQDQQNQNRLIELLTARGNVAEVIIIIKCYYDNIIMNYYKDIPFLYYSFSRE